MPEKVFCKNCRWLRTFEPPDEPAEIHECEAPANRADSWLEPAGIAVLHPAVRNLKNDCDDYEPKEGNHASAR